jgi:hypothetical protein
MKTRIMTTALLVWFASIVAATAGQRAAVDERIATLDVDTARLTLLLPGEEYTLVGEKVDPGPPPRHCNMRIFAPLRISQEEMSALLHVLTESRYYNWQPITALGLPRSQTVLVLQGPSSQGFQCSLGRGAESAKSLERLIPPLKPHEQEFLKLTVASLTTKTGQPFQDAEKQDLSGVLGPLYTDGNIAGKKVQDIVTEETTVRTIVLVNDTDAQNGLHLGHVARFVASNPTLQSPWTTDPASGLRKCDPAFDHLRPFFAVLLEGKNGRFTGVLFCLDPRDKPGHQGQIVKIVTEAGIGFVTLPNREPPKGRTDPRAPL